MPKVTKKILCYTAITGILNLSFQPVYAGKSGFSLKSEEISYTQKVSHHLTRKERMSDLGLEDSQTNFTRTSQSATEIDNVSWFFLTPLKTMIGAVSLVKQGVRFVLENPRQTMTMGLLLQARTATSTLSLSSLTPDLGFTINGAAEGDLFGYSVSSAGDFNGDGLNDVVIGVPRANNLAGQSYVIYGTNSTSSSLSLSSLTPLQGFNITGARHDNSGHSVSSAGDFNGDGLSDIIIGAPEANYYAGKSYVIYGTNSTPPSINLTSLTPNQGLTLYGAVADFSGWSVSSAGDFNGDGLDDIIIGALYGNNNAGNSYVIYGTNNSTLSSLSLSSLTPNQGFTISGAAAYDQFGNSVSSAGDFNGDGLGDIIIGAWGSYYASAGKSYVIYGTNSTPPSINLTSLTPNQGFNITGVALGRSGSSVSSAGDFNGDGLNDVIIGAPGGNSGGYSVKNYTGKSYIIYGTNSKPSSLSLSSLTPNQGFNITGAAPGDLFGWSVSSAGDFNGDGLSDVIIGAPAGYNAKNYTGKSYVIYGTNSTPSSLNLSSLTSTQGFTITSTVIGDWSDLPVSSAGDFNGDGLNDVIIGAPAIIGTPGANSYVGNSYVIYGRDNTTFPSLIVPAPLPAPAPPPAPAPLPAAISAPLPLPTSASPSVTSTPSTEESETSTATSQMTSVSPTSAPVSTVSSQTSASTSMSEFTSTNPMPSSITISSSPTSAGTGTSLNPITSKVISSPFMSTPSNSHTDSQDEANGASSQSLSHLFAGATFLIGQERF